MNVIQSLKSLTAYPIPSATVQGIAEECGLQPDAALEAAARNSAEFKRAKARVYIYLLSAPNVSQNGVSFSFTSDERKHFKAAARKLLAEIGDDITGLGLGVSYGYKGEDL